MKHSLVLDGMPGRARRRSGCQIVMLMMAKANTNTAAAAAAAATATSARDAQFTLGQNMTFSTLSIYLPPPREADWPA